MQTSGTFPQLSDGRKKAKPAKKSRSEAMEDGRGWTKHQPRPVNAPKTTSERRDLAHKKAAGTMKKGC